VPSKQKNHAHTVAGLDVAPMNTGYSKRWGKTGEIRGVIKSPEDLGSENDLFSIEQFTYLAFYLQEIIKECDLVAIESLAYSAHGNQTKNIAGVNWLAQFLCYVNAVPYTMVLPQHVKMFAGVKGNAKKVLVREGVRKIWGENLRNDNIADAFILMKMAQAIVNREERQKLSESQVAVLQRPVRIQEIRHRKAMVAELGRQLETSMLATGIVKRDREALFTILTGPISQQLGSVSTVQDS